MQNEERRRKAVEILSQLGVDNLEYLGMGCEGVVFHDNQSVYKVYVNCPDALEIKRRVSFFFATQDCRTLYAIDKCIEIDDAVVITYLYEPSSPCHNYSEHEAIEFLVECFQHKMAIRDCKPHNFVRVGDTIRFIDMEACNYTDNLFLNMCARMYMYIYYYDTMPVDEFQKLKRSAINNFDLPELNGLRDFVNKVFANVIFGESHTAIARYQPDKLQDGDTCTMDSLPNLEQLFYTKLKENQYLADVQCGDIFLNDNLYFEPRRRTDD